MSHQFAMSGASQCNVENMPSPQPGRAPCKRPATIQKTNPLFTGLATPPESPICFIPQDAASSVNGQSTPEPSRETFSAAEVRMLLETLSPPVRDPNTTPSSSPLLSPAVFSGEYAHHQPSPKTPESDCIRGEPSKPSFQSSGVSQPTLVDISSLSEEIYSIVEHVVEQQMADAMGPLRLNINRLDDSLESFRHQQSTFDNLKSHFHRENTDLRDQNDTMSRQLDLHYRTIEQHTEVFNSHVKAMNSMSEAQAKNIQTTTDSLTAAASIAGQLSQVVMNLPLVINQVVQSAVQQQTQIAMREILNAQQQAMLSLQDVPRIRESVSSDRSSISMPPLYCQHSLEVESVSSIQHGHQLDRHTSQSSTKSKGGFRHTLRKLFKCTPKEQSR